MKRIYNTETKETIWQGEDYLIDNQPGEVPLPYVLLTDILDEAPAYDETTQFLVPVESREGILWKIRYEVKQIPVIVPEQVDGAAAQIVIRKSGLEPYVLYEIEHLPEDQRDYATLQWNSCAPLRRHGPLVTLFIEKIPMLNDTLADQLFVEAEKLSQTNS